jgi:hypothetical protein
MTQNLEEVSLKNNQLVQRIKLVREWISPQRRVIYQIVDAPEL